MANARHDIVAIGKNAKANVQIALQEYKGNRNIDIRTFLDWDGNGLKATQKGVSLKVGEIDALIAGLQKAKEKATELGW